MSKKSQRPSRTRSGVGGVGRSANFDWMPSGGLGSGCNGFAVSQAGFAQAPEARDEQVMTAMPNARWIIGRVSLQNHLGELRAAVDRGGSLRPRCGVLQGSGQDRLRRKPTVYCEMNSESTTSTLPF